MQPDKTDWKIIHMLSEKHMTNTTIARKLGVSEGTIRQRLKRLQNDGILRIKALRDPNLLDNQQLALVAANVGDLNTSCPSQSSPASMTLSRKSLSTPTRG